MSIFTIVATSFIVALSGAMSPGPLLAVTVNRSLTGGAKTGPLLITGHSILELLLVIFLVAGFKTYLTHPVFTKIYSIVGGCLLMGMAFGMVWKPVPDLSGLKVRNNAGSSIFAGVLVSLSNPYWAIWWITIGITYLSIVSPRGVAGISAFFFGHIGADFLWYSIVSFFVSRGKQRIKPGIYAFISIFCGIFLAVFGISLIAKAII